MKILTEKEIKKIIEIDDRNPQPWLVKDKDGNLKVIFIKKEK